MMNAIQRVISGDDIMQDDQNTNQQLSTTQRQQQSEDVGMSLDDDSSGNRPRATHMNSPRGGHQPHVVEQETNENSGSAMDTTHFHIASASTSETPRSSLSDVSAAQGMNMEEDEEEDFEQDYKNTISSSGPPEGAINSSGSRPRLNRTAINSSGSRPRLNRMDPGQQAMQHLASASRSRNTERQASSDESSSVGKTTNSQSSSRDWGWFEDVHASDHGLLMLGQANRSPSGAGGKQKENSGGSGGHHNPKQGNSHSRASPAHSQPNSLKNKTSHLVPSTDSMLEHETLQPIVTRDPETDAAAMAVTAPNYVLEESLSSQRLWKDTAGQRPPQPVEERAFFEKMWAQNFARSQVEYKMPVEVLTATTPISLNPFADGNFDTQDSQLSNYNLSEGAGGGDSQKGDTLTVLVKGDNVFGTTVSKSFARASDNGGPISGVDTVNISIASYRVVESKKHGKYAQFLVIYREGSIRDTIGVWKRYSDFQELSRKVTQAHEGCAAVIANMSPLAVTEEHEVEHLPNAITSWRLLKKRQRWYRCLDAGYLSLKVFLLERFLHDILFESSSPDLLRDFVGVAQPR
eukprot:CAMPEP_0176165842 /NCGR_PEP_ID=MMETSP0120_2-20121206/84820_1 /TAXON_ID=160619 /ORGANISM="Kryptoperidinium foliaceum, Strain CCMP 1326" /LENGTH=576 /DNA_ID=CAMNT_0017503373 /DNA_START=127 /DNA_END=1855 /DNA_ORIENTATION=-